MTDTPPTDVSSKDGSSPAEQHNDVPKNVQRLEELYHQSDVVEYDDEEIEIEW